MPTKVTNVSLVLDNVAKVFKALEETVGKQILIGIPDDNAERKDGNGMTNASIGYLMEYGSPAQNIPARPFLIPGVEKARGPALTQIRKAANAALDGDSKKALQFLNAAGIIGANEVRGMINSNIPPPLSPRTIAARRHARGTKKQRASEVDYFNLLALGLTNEQAQGDAGIKSLINTGQLAASITYVIRESATSLPRIARPRTEEGLPTRVISKTQAMAEE